MVGTLLSPRQHKLEPIAHLPHDIRSYQLDDESFSSWRTQKDTTEQAVSRLISTMGLYERSIQTDSRPEVSRPEHEEQLSPRAAGRLLRIPRARPPPLPLACSFASYHPSGSQSARLPTDTQLQAAGRDVAADGSPKAATPRGTTLSAHLLAHGQPDCSFCPSCPQSAAPSARSPSTVRFAEDVASLDTSVVEKEVPRVLDPERLATLNTISPGLLSIALKLHPTTIPEPKLPHNRNRFSQIVIEPRPERGRVLPRKSQISRRRPAGKHDMATVEQMYMANKNASEEKRVAAMSAHQVFHGCTLKQLRLLARLGKPYKFKKFATIYRDGARANCLYILTRGSVEHNASEGPNSVIKVNDETSPHGICFGFEGLSMGEARRPDTVTALEDCEVLQVSLEGLPTLGVSMDEDWVRKLSKRSTELAAERALRTMPLFHGLPQKTMQELSSMFDVREYGVGGISIFEQGDPGDGLFILLTGRVAVIKNGLKLDTLIADPNLPRPFFGEMALLNGSVRTASVVTAAPARILVMHQAHFSRFNSLVPDFVERLSRIKKLREKHTEIVSAPQMTADLRKSQGAILSVLNVSLKKTEAVLQMM
ncbi:hypothetical protein AB1Y20_001459 [Prymnesium parvum]|uniref:Cyclic nucleotide-binding domain-containing protein n=1 Tax=Prymnesium parvum TaxID=97485 RepID=A0AB34KBC5_PRYPA